MIADSNSHRSQIKLSKNIRQHSKPAPIQPAPQPRHLSDQTSTQDNSTQSRKSERIRKDNQIVLRQ